MQRGGEIVRPATIVDPSSPARLHDVSRYERCASQVLGARVTSLCMHPSFGALDVDRERELEIYRNRFDEIKAEIAQGIEQCRALPGE